MFVDYLQLQPGWGSSILKAQVLNNAHDVTGLLITVDPYNPYPAHRSSDCVESLMRPSTTMLQGPRIGD
jgi:hypothetical protein